MKFCHYHYEKTKHPKFYDKACELLEKAKKCAFTSQNEVDIFVNMVTKALDEHKPQGHSSKVMHIKSADGDGQITICTGKLDDDIARLYYQPVVQLLEYDHEVKAFFDISERFGEETEGNRQLQKVCSGAKLMAERLTEGINTLIGWDPGTDELDLDIMSVLRLLYDLREDMTVLKEANIRQEGGNNG